MAIAPSRHGRGVARDLLGVQRGGAVKGRLNRPVPLTLEPADLPRLVCDLSPRARAIRCEARASPYTLRSAAAGASRAARMAGYSPASAPSALATATAPPTASSGTTTIQPCRCAYAAVAAAPRPM